MPRIADEVITPGLCIGCGVCAGVCPHGALDMQLDRTGIYRPYRVSEMCSECLRCERVCPFLRQNADVSAVTSDVHANTPYEDEWLGRYHGCFHAVAPDEGTRLAGTSGGVATWLLVEALETGLVDGAWCVAAGDDAVPAFVLAQSSADVMTCSGSKYHPVHLAEVVSSCLSAHEGSFAVVVLPCQAHALRLAQRVVPALAERLKLVVGLTCGQGKTRYYSDGLVTASRKSEEVVEAVDYRAKTEVSASDYETRVRFTGPAGERSVSYPAMSLAALWRDRVSSPYACCFCDDVFCEAADVSVMDAWLPNFTSDWRGTSLVVCRDAWSLERLSELCDRGYAAPVSASEVCASQAGSVADKGTGAALRHEWAGILHLPSLKRRGRVSEVGRVQKVAWFGAYLVAASSRLGPPHAPFGQLGAYIGRVLCRLAALGSALVIAARRESLPREEKVGE